MGNAFIQRVSGTKHTVEYYKHDDFALQAPGLGIDGKLKWFGKIASELHLKDEVAMHTLSMAFSGKFPNNISLEKAGNKKHRAAFDMVFGAPKSLSIQCLLYGDKVMADIHAEAVKESLSYAESLVGTRIKVKGVVQNEVTGKALIARATHTVNRNLEPFIHDHCLFLNITKSNDNKYRAMDSKDIYEMQGAIGNFYYYSVANKLKENNYDIYFDNNNVPQLKGYSREQLMEFSTRRKDIEELINKNSSFAERKIIALKTRKAKRDTEVTEQLEEWYSKANSIGIKKVLPGKEILSKEKENSTEYIQQALQHLLEKEAQTSISELIQTAIKFSKGNIHPSKIISSYKKMLNEGEIFESKSGKFVTSLEMRLIERSILGIERKGRGKSTSIYNEEEAKVFLLKSGLTDEQNAAARFILTSNNFATGITGYAGTGKTTTTKALVDGFEAKGYKVIGLSPQRSGVTALREASISNASTVARFNTSKNMQLQVDNKTILFVDEAGLLNMKDTEKVLSVAKAAGARVLFFGDTKQYESVEAGPALKALERNGMPTKFITKMQRQAKANEAVKSAAQLSVDKASIALEVLEKNDKVIEINNSDTRYSKLADKYIEKRLSSKKQETDTYILTGTHASREAINSEVRDRLKKLGIVSNDTVDIKAFKKKDISKVEKKMASSYNEGDTIFFNSATDTPLLKAKSYYTVVSVDDNKNELKVQNGKRIITINASVLPVSRVEVGTVSNIDIGVGEEIRFTSNKLDKLGIENGTQGKVVGISTEDMKIQLTNSKKVVSVPLENPIDIQYAYSRTSYSTQGLGFPNVILNLETKVRTTNSREFYVALTRSKEDAIVYTDNTMELKKIVSVRPEKSTSLEEAVGIHNRDKDININKNYLIDIENILREKNTEKEVYTDKHNEKDKEKGNDNTKGIHRSI